MSLYEKLKKNKIIEYYFIGPKNNSWGDTFRNPFFGIKQTLGVKNVNPTTYIDIRICYYPYEKDMPLGCKKTLGESLIKIRIPYIKLILLEIRKSHPNDGLYYNGLITFAITLTKKYFPWITFNIRPYHKRYLNFGIGWEGTSEQDKKIAEFGLKLRIANYYTEYKWNPGVVSTGWNEGHI